MSDKLPVISGRELVRVLQKLGYESLGYGKGDHIKVAHRGTKVVLSVPDHRELARGTLKRLMRDAGLNNDDLARLL